MLGQIGKKLYLEAISNPQHYNSQHYKPLEWTLYELSNTFDVTASVPSSLTKYHNWKSLVEKSYTVNYDLNKALPYIKNQSDADKLEILLKLSLIIN